jgi:outer membrane protein TolC
MAGLRAVTLPGLFVFVCAAYAAAPPALTLLDAVRSTVALHPLVKAAEQDIAVSLARRMQASGAFDLRYNWTASTSRTYAPLTDYNHALALAAGINSFSDTLDTSDINAGATQLLRNGISLSPTFDLNHLGDNFSDIGGVNAGRIDFQVNVPLRRGRGREAVTASERSAADAVDASTLERNETIANLVYSTATAYWNYVAALRVFEIHQESEKRGQEFLSSVRTLIDAGRMPGIQSHEAIANLESQTTARIAAGQRIVEARQNLGYAMGIGALDAQTLGAPSEAFPESAGPTSLATANSVAWVSSALTLRAGYLATDKLSASADLLRTNARNQLQPQLDVFVKSGYSGLAQGSRPDQFVYGLAHRLEGLDLYGGITYSFARGNNLAKGQFEEAEANYRKSLYMRSDAANKIASSVLSALSGVDTSAAALGRARHSVAEYETALDGAREQLRLAAGSLLDLLTIEARLTAAQLDLVSAQLDYALAIVQLRYTTGTMLGADPLRPALERQVFFQPPNPPETKP